MKFERRLRSKQSKEPNEPDYYDCVSATKIVSTFTTFRDINITHIMIRFYLKSCHLRYFIHTATTPVCKKKKNCVTLTPIEHIAERVHETNYLLQLFHASFWQLKLLVIIFSLKMETQRGRKQHAAFFSVLHICGVRRLTEALLLLVQSVTCKYLA